MKEMLLRYADYNVWANGLITEVLLTLTDEQADMEMVSSFPTIRKTVHHTMAAEDTWLKRLQQVAQPVWVGDSFGGTLADACAFWTEASAKARHFVVVATDDELNAMLHYKDRSGNEHATPVCEILHHMFNHSTYHRGQLVTMLRQCGITSIPGTDFIAFARLR